MNISIVVRRQFCLRKFLSRLNQILKKRMLSYSLKSFVWGYHRSISLIFKGSSASNQPNEVINKLISTAVKHAV